MKPIENAKFGVPNFWVKVFCNHKQLKAKVSEKDRDVLKYLANVQLELHEKGFGFELIFTFDKENPYFEETQLKKVFLMKNFQECDKAQGTKISWTAGSDVTFINKKIKKGKKVKKIEKVKCASFFNFFETHETPEVPSNKKVQIDGEWVEEQDPEVEAMEKDYKMGEMLRDEIVPFAIETYLSVMTGEGDSEGEDQDDDEGSDDDEVPKLVKK